MSGSQRLKWIVYALLFLDFILYLYEDAEAAQYVLGDAPGLLDYGAAYVTSIDLAAWFTLILMDVWHWTSLVALLAYAGLVSIPDAYYQAARIDGASKWSVFRFIQLPKMARVLTIAVLLRFMDSFMIFTEPFAVIAGGDPVFLSTELKQTVELGQKAAMSLIYFMIILAFSWVFYTVMTRDDGEPTGQGGAS